MSGPPIASASRVRELEDPLNRYLYHPLAAWLARSLRPTGISPNAVSVGGMLCVWGAAWAYAALAWPLGALLGFALHIGWHVVDGADGDLARMTGRASPTGELVDGFCDYGAHVVLYVVLAAILDDQIGGWAWALAAVCGASHMVQTNHAETQRRSYLWWAYGVPWLKHARADDDDLFRERNALSRTYLWLTRLYLNAAAWMAPWSARLDRLVEEARHDPDRTARIRSQVRESWKSLLAFEKAVGPNPRTIMLGLSMLAGSPLWYFIGEAVLLNLVLVASIARHNRVGHGLVERLA